MTESASMISDDPPYKLVYVFVCLCVYVDMCLYVGTDTLHVYYVCVCVFELVPACPEHFLYIR